MENTFQRKLDEAIQNIESGSQKQMSDFVEDLLAGGVHDVGQLIEVLRDTEISPSIRQAAAWLLGRVGSAKDVPHLAFVLYEDNETLVVETLLSLGLIGGKRAVTYLRDFTSKKHLNTIRGVAIYALGSIGDIQVIPVLLSILEDEEEPSILRGSAAEALHRYLPFLETARHMKRAVINALHDPSPEVRLWSVYATAELHVYEALPLLHQLIADDTAVVQGWGSIADEAKQAVNRLTDIGDAPPNSSV